jgi:hypothetical protein
MAWEGRRWTPKARAEGPKQTVTRKEQYLRSE